MTRLLNARPGFVAPILLFLLSLRAALFFLPNKFAAHFPSHRYRE